MENGDKQTICLLNDSFPPFIDGVANTVMNYAALIEARHGHAFVVTPENPDADDSAYPYPVLRYPGIDLRSQVGYVAGLPFSPDVARRLKQDGTCLLHSHCPFASTLFACELREALDTPVITTYHTKFDIEIAKVLKSRTAQDGIAHALVQGISASDEVWVVSRGAGENLRSLGFEGDYVVMSNGVDMPLGSAPDEDVKRVTEGYDLPAHVPVFLFVGRLMWYKGLRIILDALAALDTSGTDFRMVFIGDGNEAATVREAARELGLGDKCIFRGAIYQREDIRAWYSRADLFLFPSTFDTNGLVVREAAASSTASVLVRDSCAAEGITDGRNGFLIEENAASLEACIRELCAHPDTMRVVGGHAASDLYLSWDSAVVQAWNRYRIVLENYHAGRYAAPRSPLRLFFRSQGSLMGALGSMASARDDVLARVEELSEGFRIGGFRSGIESALHVDKVLDSLPSPQELKDGLWEKLDRYL